MSKCVSSECPGKLTLLLTVSESNGVSFPPAWPGAAQPSTGWWGPLQVATGSFTQSNSLSLGACETTLGSQNQRIGETLESLQPPGPLRLSSSSLPAPMPHDFLQQARGGRRGDASEGRPARGGRRGKAQRWLWSPTEIHDSPQSFTPGFSLPASSLEMLPSHAR